MTAYLKAIVGAIIAGLASLQQSLDDDKVTNAEWSGIGIATLSALVVVWAVPNVRTMYRSGETE